MPLPIKVYKNTEQDFRDYLLIELDYSIDSAEYELTAQTFGFDDEYADDYKQFLSFINKGQ